jgi:hypothetical protein
MPKQNKKSEAKSKGKGLKVEEAIAGSDDDFDDMLAELRAVDVTAKAVTNTNSSASISNNSSTSTSSFGSTKRTSAPTAEEVSEEALVQACIRGDISQLQRWARRGVRV